MTRSRYAAIILLGVILLALTLLLKKVSSTPTHLRDQLSFAEPVLTANSPAGMNEQNGSRPWTTPRLPVDTGRPAGIRGVVRDMLGAPIEGVEVWIVGTSDPFSGVEVDPFNSFDVSFEDKVGKSVVTVSDGSYAAAIPDGRSALVRVDEVAGYRPVVSEQRVQAPAADVDFVFERLAVGKARVRVYNPFSGDYVTNFGIEIRHKGGPGEYYATRASKIGALDLEFPIPGNNGLLLNITLVSPASTHRSAKEALLEANKTAEVELLFQPDHQVNGQVVNENGMPVENATVSFDSAAFHGGEFCQDAFQERTVGSVSTNSDGQFTINGCGEYLTVRHEHYSTAKVRWTEASSVVMRKPASLDGVLVDGAGRGVEGLYVQLDEAQTRYTDEGGRFSFPSIDAGLHCLKSGDDLYGIWVEPGESKSVRIALGTPRVHVRLHTGQHAYRVEFAGLVVSGYPEERILAVAGSDGALTERLPARTGDLLIGALGQLARISVVGGEASAELGESKLVIEGPPGQRVFVLPTDCTGSIYHAAALLLAMPLPDSGVLSLEPFPEGNYWIEAVDSEKRVRVEVGPSGAVVPMR